MRRYNFFFFNDTATTEIYTLSLHDALPIYVSWFNFRGPDQQKRVSDLSGGERNRVHLAKLLRAGGNVLRSEEHTSELQSRQYLVCRLLLEKKKKNRMCQRLYRSTSPYLEIR